MDYLLFTCFSLIALYHLLICIQRRKRPHWSAGINMALAGIICPLAAIGILFIALGVLLVL